MLNASQNRSTAANEILMENGWPQWGASDAGLSSQLSYLEGLKREIRLALDKSMAGGKKKGKKGKG